MPPAPGHLAAHLLPPGIVGALGLGGYQLLAEIGGIGVGRLGAHAFLLAAADPTPGLADPGAQIALHHDRLRDEAELAPWTQLAAQLGYLRLAGYHLALERDGLRSNLSLVDPASGRIAARIPARHPGLLGARGPTSAAGLLAGLRRLAPPGLPADARDPELLRQVILALALADDELGAVEPVELTDRAVALARAAPALDPPGALAAARREA